MSVESSLRTYEYRVVDVFTQHALEGNALAVFPEAGGLDGALMQRIARELNRSETTFVLPATRPDCASRVRIFTPAREMAFAGHPTIGTAAVLRDTGRLPKSLQEFSLQEEVGPVAVRIERGADPLIWLRTPAITLGRQYDREACARVLGLSQADLMDAAPQHLSAGNPTIFVALKSREAVDSASVDLQGLLSLKQPDTEPACIFVFTPTRGGAYSRMFAPEYGITEDPATGSSTGPLAAYMLRHRMVSGDPGTRFISEQGTKMGRRSLLHVQIWGRDGADGIDVGGHVAPLATASMTLPVARES